MNTKVCMIGHFGGTEPFFEGQTIKTRNLERALRCYGPQLTIYKADTFDLRRNSCKFLWNLIRGIVSCDRILLCVSIGGRRAFFPLMYILSRYFHKRVFHCAIGGRLADEVSGSARVKKYVQSFRKNWVESRQLARNLHNLGISNGEYLPNFKFLPEITPEELPTQWESPLRCVMFSRISAEKGVGDAIDAVVGINRERAENAIELDIYGAVDDDFTQPLEQLLRQAGGAVRYCGTAEPEKSISVIRKYDVLLFPTRRNREGMPGTIIDALTSGVPVIARRWQYCNEMLTHGQTGYCYDFDQPQLLTYWLEYALTHREELLSMRGNCLSAARQYSVQAAAPVMVRELLEG